MVALIVAERDNDAVVALLADIGKEAAVPIEDQHVLRQVGGGKASYCGELADRLRGDSRDGHQRQGQHGDGADDQVPPQHRAATPVPLSEVIVGVPVRVAPPVAAPHGFTRP
jgi:hypothetical protein